jgi:hypothetical protein
MLAPPLKGINLTFYKEKIQFSPPNYHHFFGPKLSSLALWPSKLPKPLKNAHFGEISP